MRYTYTESVIPGKADRHYRKRLLMLLILTVASLLMAAVSTVFLVCAVVTGVMCYKTWQNADVEYEYVHTNDIFDIDMVIRNASRKQVLSINLNQVVSIIPADSSDACRYSHLKEEDFSDGVSKDKIYLMIITANGKQKKLRLQLEPEMLHSLRQWIPEKIVVRKP